MYTTKRAFVVLLKTEFQVIYVALAFVQAATKKQVESPFFSA